MRTQRKAQFVGAGLAVWLTMALAACADSGIDKAGGRDRTAPVVLTFATNQAFMAGPLETYAQDVERQSGGKLRIDVKVAWRWNEPTQEVGLIADVQAGKVDMAWIGARAFDSVGVTSFQALVAPFLIDSYDLEGRVFDAGIPGRMLEGLDTIGLTGIGVLPGPLRKMTGTSHRFAEPGDFADQVVGTSGGALAEQTFRALGATPRLIPASNNLDGLDGYDFQLEAVPQDGDATVVANLNLWPRPLVVVMNADRFNGLSPEQQQILRRVVADATKPALEVTRAEEAHAGSGLCIVGMKVVTATASDLAALRDAVLPVYANLEKDPQNERLSRRDPLVESAGRSRARVLRVLARANRRSLGNRHRSMAFTRSLPRPRTSEMQEIRIRSLRTTGRTPTCSIGAGLPSLSNPTPYVHGSTGPTSSMVIDVEWSFLDGGGNSPGHNHAGRVLRVRVEPVPGRSHTHRRPGKPRLLECS